MLSRYLPLIGSTNSSPMKFWICVGCVCTAWKLEAGGERLVFDCGRGCTTRLWQLRLPLGSVKLFLTHLHSDHTVGIPDLWLTGWLTQPYGTRKEKFHVWGPLGTVEMMAKMEAAY